MTEQELDSILFNLGEDHGKYFNAVAPPIIQTSNFKFDTIGGFRQAILEEDKNHIYTRGINPTVDILRKKIAALEYAEDCLITGSGSSAIAAAVSSLVSTGDHIICVEKPYSWTHKLLTQFLSRYGVTCTFVDGTDIQKIKAAKTLKTKILFLESPNSITYELQDLSACGAWCKEHGIVSIIDNSYCSPIYQNPIRHGIDIVIHSGTKYLNGHSDVVMGVICGSRHHISKIFHDVYMTFGTILSPHDAWLALRGLRTLLIRMKEINQTCKEVMKFLDSHPRVRKVIHPFHEEFPQRELALRQMEGHGGLFTIDLDMQSKTEVSDFVHKIKRFKMAVSWGGHESLMLPSLIFHDMEGREPSPIPWTYVRFYVGLESSEYLIDDLKNALSRK